MSNFCSQCGNEVEDNQDFCPNCGNPIKNGSPVDLSKSQTSNSAPSQPKEDLYQFGNAISKKIRTSAILWLIGSILAFILTLCTICQFLTGDADIKSGAYLCVYLGLFVWYLVLTISRFRRSAKAKNSAADFVEEYSMKNARYIVMLVINVFCLSVPGILGIISSILEITTKNYVLQNSKTYQPTGTNNYNL